MEIHRTKHRHRLGGPCEQPALGGPEPPDPLRHTERYSRRERSVKPVLRTVGRCTPGVSGRDTGRGLGLEPRSLPIGQQT